MQATSTRLGGRSLSIATLVAPASLSQACAGTFATRWVRVYCACPAMNSGNDANASRCHCWRRGMFPQWATWISLQCSCKIFHVHIMTGKSAEIEWNGAKSTLQLATCIKSISKQVTAGITCADTTVKELDHQLVGCLCAAITTVKRTGPSTGRLFMCGDL